MKKIYLIIVLTLATFTTSFAQIQKAEKVWFDTHNITDNIVALNGAMYGGGFGVPFFPIPVTMLSQFWIQNDNNGNPRLCTYKTNIPSTMAATFQDNSVIPPVFYNTNAKNFTAIMEEDTRIVWYPQ